MTRVALTGAGGNVGRELLDAFGDGHAVVPFTHSEHEDLDSELLDVTDPDAVADALDGFDVVVHLAGASSPETDWDTVVDVNFHGTKHVLDAAVENGVERVVFASSNHAVGMYNTADPAEPEQMVLENARTVGADASPRPDTYYGVSKAACEALTNFYADRHGLEVVNLRIGWYLDEDDLREHTGEAVERVEDRFARAMWLSPHDCRDVHRKAALADLSESPVTLNAVSRNDERTYTLTETMRVLGYTPRDNAAETLAE
ncbi:NAD-dependent epimerase/dehydratase family protein [Halobacterium zhouii]|uniref:NAD-dependent epimerase/dehydratase family protein n=1 Tax=Halobacterium zhouii TaxID=2902624 RepID=UPI001E611A44|nr:NAD(P)-dependent oxidoreductase [Halobacterium zhouii]